MAEETWRRKNARRNQRNCRFREPDDASCLQRIRALVDKMGHPLAARFDYKEAEHPAIHQKKIYGISPRPARQYDMRRGDRPRRRRQQIRGISRRVWQDGGLRLRPNRRWPWDVANNKKHVPTIDPATGEKRIEFGGVIYTESAEKAARFIMDCNQNLVPLIFCTTSTASCRKRGGVERHYPRGRKNGERRIQ